MHIFVEVNNYCDVACIFCVAKRPRKYPPADISLEFFSNILEARGVSIGDAVFFTGGEPLLNRQLPEMIRMARRKGVYTYLTTNGTALHDKNTAARVIAAGISRIAVPIYGKDEETHDFIVQRKGKYRQVLAGLDNLLSVRAEMGAKTKIEVRSLVCRANLNQLPQIIQQLTARFGVLDWFGIVGSQVAAGELVHADECFVSLQEARETLCSGIDEALSLGWRVCLSGLPVCIIGPERAEHIASATQYHQLTGPAEPGGKVQLRMFPHWAYYPTMTSPEQGVPRTASSKIKGKKCYLCDRFASCSGIDMRYVMHMGVDDLVPILKEKRAMTDFDMEAFAQAGFECVVRDKIRYADDEFAAGYLTWGFDAKGDKLAEVNFLVEKMNLTPGQSVLDIACGDGVSSVMLAGKGQIVTAVDISPVFIDAGKAAASKSETAPDAGAISWVCADFFAFPCGQHDAAILLDPGFEVANGAFGQKIAEVVKPGGLFFLRYKDGTHGCMNLPSVKWHYSQKNGAFLLEQHHFDQVAGKVMDEWITIDFKQKQVLIETMERRITLFPDFVEMMGGAGFALVHAWGDLNGNPVTDNSRIYAMFVKLPK